MFGRQAPVHDHNLGRLHEALLGKGIKKKGPRVERGRIGKGSVVLYDPNVFYTYLHGGEISDLQASDMKNAFSLVRNLYPT